MWDSHRHLVILSLPVVDTGAHCLTAPTHCRDEALITLQGALALVAGNWAHRQESPLVKGRHLAQSYSSSHNPHARTGLCEGTKALPLALLSQTLMCQSSSRAPTGSNDVKLPLHLTCLSLSLCPILLLFPPHNWLSRGLTPLKLLHTNLHLSLFPGNLI